MLQCIQIQVKTLGLALQSCHGALALLQLAQNARIAGDGVQILFNKARGAEHLWDMQHETHISFWWNQLNFSIF